MGTQQILLIVLSVIIVGAAIAVGIQMFNSQAYSANKSAIAADAQSFASQIVQYFKTPTSQGGAGGTVTAGMETAIGEFIGWGSSGTDNDSGEYRIAAVTDGATTITIFGLGNEEKDGEKPAVRTSVRLSDGVISARVIDSDKTLANLTNADFGS